MIISLDAANWTVSTLPADRVIRGIAASLIGVMGAIGPGFATDILRLSETGANTGVFVGYIATATNAATADCALQVERNAEIDEAALELSGLGCGDGRFVHDRHPRPSLRCYDAVISRARELATCLLDGAAARNSSPPR